MHGHTFIPLGQSAVASMHGVIKGRHSPFPLYLTRSHHAGLKSIIACMASRSFHQSDRQSHPCRDGSDLRFFALSPSLSCYSQANRPLILRFTCIFRQGKLATLPREPAIFLGDSKEVPPPIGWRNHALNYYMKPCNKRGRYGGS